MTGELVTFELNKLVRDNIPDIMRGLGEEPEVTYLEGVDLYREHVKKIIEEYSELKKTSPESPQYIKELADLADAAEALVEKFDPSDNPDLVALLAEIEDLIKNFEDQDALIECRKQRKEERGGFSRGAYVGKLALKAGDEWIEYYRQDPERFPEL